MTNLQKARLKAMHGRWERQDAKSGYTVYRGTQPAYRVQKVTYTELILVLTISVVGGLLTTWVILNA